MKKDKTIFFICISLIVGIIIGVLMCFVLQPFAGGSSASNSSTRGVNERSVTTEFVDKTLAGTYDAVSEDIYYCYFELNEDGSYRGHVTGIEETGTWIRKGDFLHVSCAYYNNNYLINGSPVYCEYEYLIYITENGLILDNRLYAKVV